MSKLSAGATITGKITAEPHLIPPAGGASTKIVWETDDVSGAEVRVSTPEVNDKLVERRAAQSK